jgi:hypothetical protein
MYFLGSTDSRCLGTGLTYMTKNLEIIVDIREEIKL